MNRPTKPLNTLEYLSMLLAKESATIIQRESTNEKTVHLYRVGEYWAAFDKSAFLLKKMSGGKGSTATFHFKEHPFPVLMHCVHHTLADSLCRKYTVAKNQLEYLQIVSTPVDARSYNKWYREHVAEI